MSSNSPRPPTAAAPDGPLPEVQLEVRNGPGRPTFYGVADASFLIGSVPGCDLRVSGGELPPLLCLIDRQPGTVTVRKLAATQPVLLNGKPATQAALNDGDHLTLGGADITVHVHLAEAAAPAPPNVPPALEAVRQHLQQQGQRFREELLAFEERRKTFAAEEDERRRQLDAQAQEVEQQRQQLAEQQGDLEGDRVAWYQRRQEIEQELRQQAEHMAALRQEWEQKRQEWTEPAQDLEQREEALAERAGELNLQFRAVEERAAEVERQRQELAAARQELADIRRQLYERYRERRDRMAGLQEAVDRAAKKVQERKREVDEEFRTLEQRRAADGPRGAALEQARQRLEDDRARFEAQQTQFQQELADRLNDCLRREDQLTTEREHLDQLQAQYREDLVRLDRLKGSLDEREQQLQERTQEIDKRLEQMQRDTRDLEEQVVQLDEWHTKLCTVGERLAKQKTEQDETAAALAKRAAALEGQQATVAALRTRLERMREEVRQGEQELAEQRERILTQEAEARQRLEEAQRLRAEVDADRSLLEPERRQVAERGAVLEAAVAQLRQAQDKVNAEEERLRQLALTLDATAAEQAESSSLLQARLAQVEDMQKRLDAEREGLRERNNLLAQAEQTREALQEQLRRRSEELSGRQKALAEQMERHAAAAAQVEARRADLERERREGQEALARLRQDVDGRAAELTQLAEALDRREADLRRQREKVQEVGRVVAAERKALAGERGGLDAEREQAVAIATQAHAELEAARREALALQQQLPELELRAGTALERLTHARDQLREHLGEVHNYARQCQEDLDGVRGQVQAEAERLQQQELALRRGQDEQRLAVAAFRQQMIDWQGQLSEMKRLLASDETRLQRQKDQVDEQARRIDADAQRLAHEAEQLQQERRAVTERRGEVERHLVDMREWYKKKLRELAGVPAGAPGVPEQPPAAPGQGRDILSLTGDVEPADRQLGELLRSLGLVEPDTLTALWVEARRQRRTLRQVLLASGAVTLYQMALIEAGNLDALMVGPVRVVDRLRVTPREVVYRVFDPRRGEDAVLRWLAESEAEDAVRPDEFRQRFRQAMILDSHIAATLEVLDIKGRPAAIQEWLTGLPSNDWPPLAAAPGVWFRLFSQAALGLHTAHQAGLLHGHLQPELFLLTADGTLKLCGFGEPPWLALPAGTDTHEDVAGDLEALGRVARDWCAATGKGKKKAMPEELLALLDRLDGPPDQRFTSTAQLLEELDAAGSEVPPNPEAWERLLRHVRDNALAEATLRQSA